MEGSVVDIFGPPGQIVHFVCLALKSGTVRGSHETRDVILKTMYIWILKTGLPPKPPLLVREASITRNTQTQRQPSEGRPRDNFSILRRLVPGRGRRSNKRELYTQSESLSYHRRGGKGTDEVTSVKWRKGKDNERWNVEKRKQETVKEEQRNVKR